MVLLREPNKIRSPQFVQKTFVVFTLKKIQKFFCCVSQACYGKTIRKKLFTTLWQILWLQKNITKQKKKKIINNKPQEKKKNTTTTNQTQNQNNPEPVSEMFKLVLNLSTHIRTKRPTNYTGHSVSYPKQSMLGQEMLSNTCKSIKTICKLSNAFK